MPYFAPHSLQLRELPPKRVRKEPRRRWFWSARCDFIVWLSDDDAVLGFQFCYDKDGAERALTWMPGCGFSHMRVDTGTWYGEAPMLVPDGPIDARRIHELFVRDSGCLPPEYVDLFNEKLGGLAAGRQLRLDKVDKS